METLENVTGYIVFFKKSTGYDYLRRGASSMSTNITGLSPGELYSFRVLATMLNGNGVASKVVFVETEEKCMFVIFFCIFLSHKIMVAFKYI